MVLIASDGKRVLSADDPFFVTLGSLAPGAEPADFAVRNLGFVKFEPIDRRVTVIELHPQSVDRRALIAAERRIAELGTKLFLIKLLDDDRSSRNALSAMQAVAELRALRSPRAAADVSTDRFQAQPQDFAKLLRDPAHPLNLLGRKWCAASGEFDPRVLTFATEHGLLESLMLVGVPRREADPVFRFIGDGLFPWLAPDYRREAIGERLETFPDRRYGTWISGFYRTVASSGQPRFDRVSAEVRVGADAQNVPYPARYERLMLPWRSASGEVLISLCARRIGSAPAIVAANDD